MTKIAINGLGRIGRAALKLILDTPDLELLAVNDLVPADNLAYLLKYDTVYGRYARTVRSEDDTLIVDDRPYKLFHEKNPERLPWGSMGVDIVLECTGKFTRREDMEKHIRGGARAVILSAPSKSAEVETIVHGVNDRSDPSVNVISCASCTTNCITPVVEVMGRRIGIKKAIMTTIHAYTSSQGIVDMPAKSFRRGRAGAQNFVPSSTGAAVATTRALPEMANKFNGVAVRGPVPVGSISDLIFVTNRSVSVDEVNDIFREESKSERYRGIMGVSSDQIVSSDIIGDPRASIVDLTMTQVVDGDLVKVMSWYDNEWGYSNQMIREAARVGKALPSRSG